mmetsp:Transcript_124715/g.313561  ORF Transcript_124715/g.313561 Transcript_124715/m.313561 type:complete len:84 (-) Transcript_124715:213-464(-)
MQVLEGRQGRVFQRALMLYQPSSLAPPLFFVRVHAGALPIFAAGTCACLRSSIPGIMPCFDSNSATASLDSSTCSVQGTSSSS